MKHSPQQTPFPLACQRWRDRRGIYRPPNEVISTHEYEVAPITVTQAKAFVKRHHYSGAYVACRYRYGLFKRYALYPEDKLVGVAVFSVPMSQKVLTNIFTCDPIESIELGRFVLLDNVPSNAESWFFARCRELLKREGIKGIVAFSDDTPRTSLYSNQPIFVGHIGNFYQASNGVYLKRTTPRTRKLLPDGSVFSDRAASKSEAANADGDMPQTFLSNMARQNRQQITLPPGSGTGPLSLPDRSNIGETIVTLGAFQTL